MLIDWTPELSVGNEQLDAEHRHWVDLLNTFYLSLKSGESPEKLQGLIDGMIAYTKFHFASEEKYMIATKFPDFEGHKEKHELYLAKLMEYDEKLKAGKFVLSLEVTNYLKSWLVNHIKGADKQYAKFAAAK
jgi:hemerythrin